jgi:hypothetical protein
LEYEPTNVMSAAVWFQQLALCHVKRLFGVEYDLDVRHRAPGAHKLIELRFICVGIFMQ